MGTDEQKPSVSQTPTFSAVPPSVLKRLDAAVPRPWLMQMVESAFTAPEAASDEGPAFILITGEPGGGKTVAAAMLAERLQCLSYFARPGSTQAVSWGDPKIFLTSLGMQLRVRFGPEIFGGPGLTVRGAVGAESVLPGAEIAGVKVDKVSLSPFRQFLFEVDVQVGELGGGAFGVNIGHLEDVTVKMSVGELAQEALIRPLERLAELRPGVRVRIIVDALDENEGIAAAIPFGDEAPPNADWVVMSRPGHHLSRFFETDGVRVVRLDLSDPELVRYEVEDARSYAHARLSEPKMAALLRDSAMVSRTADELAEELAQASRGNFLYLYHLMREVCAEAGAGRFDLLAGAANALPRGLDGVYSFFVVQRIRGSVGADEWRGRYAPTLGVLAVARAPLTSTQLAAYAGVEAAHADEVIGAVRQFLEQSDARDDAAYYIYHHSFAEFLLTQDRRRNPYPLDPAETFHLRVAAYYESFNDDAWRASSDRYALTHLPTHLIRARELGRTVELLRGAFGWRQMTTVGPARTRSHYAAAARAAAESGQDSLLFQLLALGLSIEAAMDAEWATGRYVLSLLSAEPSNLPQRAGFTSASLGIGAGGSTLPWSGFLVAERLLDLGDAPAALEVLREVLRRPWLDHRPEVRGSGLAEGSNFDFTLETDEVAFLARVARLDPDLALALNRRLFVDRPLLPNVRTAWRDVIHTFLRDAPGGGGPTAEECRELADTTCLWLRQGGYTLGWAGVIRGLFRLLAHALPVYDPLKLSEAIITAAECRMVAHASTQGADDKGDVSPGIFLAVADVLEGLMSLLEAADGRRGVPPAPGAEEGPQLRDLLKATAEQVAAICPPAVAPDMGSHSSRAEALGQLTAQLYRAGSERWREYARAALVTCEMDASIPDPPIYSVARGLSWLRRMGDPSVRAEAEAIIERQHLAENIEAQGNDGEAALDEWRGPASLKRLAEETVAYRRGRIALTLYRDNAASLKQLSSALESAAAKKPGGRRRRRAAEPFELSDVLCESLVLELNACAETWAADLMSRLDARRSPGRQKSHVFDPQAMRHSRWRVLEDHGRLDKLRAELTEDYWQAIPERDMTERFHCCMHALSFDLELADWWLASLVHSLRYTEDRGAVVVYLTRELKRRRPESFDEFGPRWLRHLPKFDASHGIRPYQIELCKVWGVAEIFRPTVVSFLRDLAEALPEEARRLSDAALEASLEQRPRRGRKRKPQKEDPWRLVGDVLGAATMLTVGDDEGSSDAVRMVVDAVTRTIEGLGHGLPDWEKSSAIREALKRVAADGGGAFEAGPAAEAVADLYDMMEGLAERADEERGEKWPHHLGRRQRVLLGLSLAVRLKQARPTWSDARLREARDLWETYLEDRLQTPGGIAGMTEVLADTFTSLLSDGFGGSRERELFEMASLFAEWCVAAPASPECLAQLHSRLNGLDDMGLRSTLLAPLAGAWLQLDEFRRAFSTVAAANVGALRRAGLYQQLTALSARPVFRAGAARPLLKETLLDLMLSPSAKESDQSLRRVLTAWLRLRASEYEEAEEAGGCGYLRTLAEWLLSGGAENLKGLAAYTPARRA